MFATDFSYGHHVTGDLGEKFAGPFLEKRGISISLVNTFEGGSPFQRYAGHMIAVSEEHGLLMDPTFNQFKMLGTQARPLFAQNVRLRANRFWQVISDDLYVRYFAADEFAELDFDKTRAEVGEMAEKIVGYMRADRP